MPESIKDKRSAVLQMLQSVHGDYHPLMELANIAMDPNTTDIKVKVDCHKTIVKYCEAELKSVEIKAEVKGDLGVLRVVVDQDDESGLELPTTFEG